LGLLGCYDYTKTSWRPRFSRSRIIQLEFIGAIGMVVTPGTESVSARILKAVYYPQSSILEAELGSHPSQIWRSILDGCEVLLQGLLKRIGDGRTTKIWSDSWLSRDYMMKPITSLMIQPPQMVSELIDETSARWREDLIRQ
jgi:hypothetical protein